MSNQKLLHGIHKQKFIGELSKTVRPQNSSDKGSMKRPRLSLETFPKATSPNKRRCLTKTICLAERQHVTLVEELCTPVLNPVVRLKKTEIHLRPSQLNTSIPWTTCIPVSLSNTLPASEMGVDSRQTNSAASMKNQSDHSANCSNQLKISNVNSSPSFAGPVYSNSKSKISFAPTNRSKTSNLLEISPPPPQIQPTISGKSITTSSRVAKPSNIQQLTEPTRFVTGSSPLLRKAATNPLLNNLLHRSTLKISLTSSAPTAHSNSLHMLPTPSTVARSRSVPVPESNTCRTKQSSLSTKSVKEARRVLQSHRVNMHDLSSNKTNERPRQISLDTKVIVVRDETPPREVQDIVCSTPLRVDLGPVISTINPLMLYPDVSMRKGVAGITLQDADFTSNETYQEVGANLPSDNIVDFLRPSRLIDYFVNQSFRQEVKRNPQKDSLSKPVPVTVLPSKKPRQAKKVTRITQEIKTKKTEPGSASVNYSTQKLEGKKITNKRGKYKLKKNKNKLNQENESGNASKSTQDQGIVENNAKKQQKENIPKRNDNEEQNNKQDAESGIASLSSSDQQIERKNPTKRKKKYKVKPKKGVLQPTRKSSREHKATQNNYT